MEVGEEAPGFPRKPCGFGLFVFVPGHSHPLQGTLGGQGAPTLCAAGSEGDPSPEGRAAAVEYVDKPLLPSPHLLIYCSWPRISYIYMVGAVGVEYPLRLPSFPLYLESIRKSQASELA